MATLDRIRHGDTPSGAAGVEVRPVRGRRELRRFIRLPWSLYAGVEQWVPPLIAERRRHLDPRRNPFFEHAEAEYFLAWRDGEPVGRISAHVDHRLSEHNHNRWGLFGFFECVDDPAVAGALLGAAEGWLRERGREELVGPMDFNTNHECGLLVEGHEYAPQILENWHHPYYARLLEAHGLEQAMDLLKWRFVPQDRAKVLPVIEELSGSLEREHGIRVRSMRKGRDFEDEVRRFVEVYEAAWSDNWGFVPPTAGEIRHMARELRPVLDEDWAWVAETAEGEVAGVAISLLDYNLVLKRMNGRLLPLGWLRFLRARGRLPWFRIFALGVKPRFQHTGVAAALYMRNWDRALERNVDGAEAGWILETNEPMNRALEALGAQVSKRYRIYAKPL